MDYLQDEENSLIGQGNTRTFNTNCRTASAMKIYVCLQHTLRVIKLVSVTSGSYEGVLLVASKVISRRRYVLVEGK